MEQVIPVVLQIVATLGIGSILLAAVNAFVNRKKLKADTTATDINSTSTLFEMYRSTASDLQERIEKLEERSGALEHENQELKRTVADMKSVIWDQQSWATRVYRLLTDEQKEQVGPPPHLASVPTSAGTPSTTT